VHARSSLARQQRPRKTLTTIRASWRSLTFPARLQEWVKGT
jgi:hypothetical protein